MTLKGKRSRDKCQKQIKNLIAFLNDDNLIRSERKKARANAKKFGGVSSAAYGGASSMGTGFGSGGSTLLVMMKILPIESMEMVVFMVNDLMIQLRLITMVPLVMTILKNMMYKPLHLKQHQNLQPALLESMQKHQKRTTKRFIRRFAFV